MRIRVRGPAGSSAITLDDSATVADLRAEISKSTSLDTFDLKYGYPPKPLLLEQHSPSAPVSELGVHLNGEQLIVGPKSSSGPQSQPSTQPAPPPPTAKSDSAPFSFAGSGSNASTAQTAPSPAVKDRAPLSLTRAKGASIESDPPEVPVSSHAATMVLRVMPDDNSCLFRAFGSAVLGSLDSMTELRSVVAQTIQAEPDVYSEVVLEQKPDDYCVWIQTEEAWGGAIELAILSKAFDVEICSVDVQSLRVDRFNDGRPTRCIICYSGIHYDTIALSPSEPPFTHAYAPPDFDTKIFEASDQELLDKAVALCKILKDRHYYTDTATFHIRCNVCGGQFVGEKGATEHAKQTGHYDFGEAG